MRHSPSHTTPALIKKVREDATRNNQGHPPSGSSNRTDLLPLLAVALNDETEEVSVQAVLTLAYMINEKTLSLLENSLKNHYGDVRYYACVGLAWLGRSERLRPGIIRKLQEARDSMSEDSFDVKLHAASSLLDLDAPQDPGIFIEAMRKEGANHAIAAGALAKLKRKDAIELIVKALEKAEDSEDHWCGKALEGLTGEAFGKDYGKWKDWLEKNRKLLPDQLK